MGHSPIVHWRSLTQGPPGGSRMLPQPSYKGGGQPLTHPVSKRRREGGREKASPNCNCNKPARTSTTDAQSTRPVTLGTPHTQGTTLDGHFGLREQAAWEATFKRLRRKNEHCSPSLPEAQNSNSNCEHTTLRAVKQSHKQAGETCNTPQGAHTLNKVWEVFGTCTGRARLPLLRSRGGWAGKLR